MAKPPRYAAIRKIALAFPEAHEIAWHGAPWFNVGTKSFALYAPENRKWILKLPHHQEMMLFDTRPETFSPFRAGRMLWCFVDVDHLDMRELKDLLEIAWRQITTKKLQKTYSGQPSTRPKHSV